MIDPANAPSFLDQGRPRREILRLAAYAACGAVAASSASLRAAVQGEAPDTANAAFDFVIARARVFDGRKTLPGLQDVGIRGGAIAAVSAAPLTGGRTIDAKDRWLIPGMIDSHIHLFDTITITDASRMAVFIANEMPLRLARFLECGVTTVLSLGDPVPETLNARNRIAAATLRGPRLFTAGLGITVPDGHPASTVMADNPYIRPLVTAEIPNAARMRTVINRLADQGVDAVKLLSEGSDGRPGSTPYYWTERGKRIPLVRMMPDLLRAGIEAAHARSLRVGVHTVNQDTAIAALEAGADALHHGVVHDRITDDRVVKLLLRNKATYVPTLWNFTEPLASANLRLIATAGVPIAMGSDSFSGRGAYGWNSLDEVERMGAAGMSAPSVLTAATADAAAYLGRDEIGTVAVGKRADLLLLDGDPTVEISNLRKLVTVFADGQLVVDRRS